MKIIVRLWKLQPGHFFCISTKARNGDWKDHFFRRSELPKVESFVEEHSDKDLYFCPHGFRKPRRLKKFAEPAKLLWADLDEANPREMEGFTPTVAWESSPGRFAALWVIDEFYTEELNKRLTYHLRADPGGWDITQVLRVPGTTNYKYTSTPKVKLLWADGDSYLVSDLSKRLPKERSRKTVDAATGIYRKYEKKFSGFVRRELLKGRPQEGKRSEVLWRLVHSLIEAGCSRDEAWELLRVSPWNKFSKRRDGDEQLRREIDKALEQHFSIVDDENPRAGERYGEEHEEDIDGEEYKYLATSMEDVEIERLDWIWYPYLAKGEVSILEGDPGLGKSYMAQMVAKAIVDGDRLPSVKKSSAVQGKVAYFDIENAAGSVTKHRLITNGLKNGKDYFQEQEPFSIDDDPEMDKVYEALDRLRPTLVVFDTLNTYIGKSDTHKASETQQAFKKFIDMARRFKCSVLVLRHLTKASRDTKALYRGQGSISFAGLARVVMTVGVSPDDEDTRVMAVTKINVVRAPKALTFTIEALPDTLKERDRSRFVWGDFVDLTADDIIAAPDREERQAQRDEAAALEQWLLEVLDDGPLLQTEVYERASMRNFSAKLVSRAADACGVIRKKLPGGDVRWILPKH